MHKKDFELIAEIITRIKGKSPYYIGDLFADAFEKVYPTFDSKKFRTFIRKRIDKELEKEEKEEKK